MYHDTTCSRCGKPIMSSVLPALCPGCKSRKLNGQRLARENRNRAILGNEEEKHFARQEYADFFGIPLSEVPDYVGTDRDPMYWRES